jgi:hypothetical protein
METPKLSPRDVIARSYPGWDADLADRLIKWLDHCGYAIVEKNHGHDRHLDASNYSSTTANSPVKCESF